MPNLFFKTVTSAEPRKFGEGRGGCYLNSKRVVADPLRVLAFKGSRRLFQYRWCVILLTVCGILFQWYFLGAIRRGRGAAGMGYPNSLCHMIIRARLGPWSCWRTSLFCRSHRRQMSDESLLL